ncbi:MAG: phosphotransferase [Prevotellaceae bacterium]|jgi:aminoglycoside/choline kinase family phosphotransferase|nr:phosphotransferase [Prevotellaceae bacterium]
MIELQSLYKQHFGYKATHIDRLPGAGSNRVYYRLSAANGQTAIGVQGEFLAENRAFVLLAKHFAEHRLPTPKVFTHTENFEFYLQEDLGNISLFDFVKKGRETGVFSSEEKSMLFRSVELLPRMQFDGAKGLDFSLCYPQAEFDRNTVFWDLNYFKYCFLKATGVEFFEPDLERDFQRLADDLLHDASHTFLYRDFQARNVMIRNEQPFFIDFQGGRKGPVFYDVASFVWQAKANYPAELREELIEHYLQALATYTRVNKNVFRTRLNLFVFFRSLQVLGAYGFRGYFEQKKHFIDSIPFAIGNLKNLLLENDFSAYPHLVSVLQTLCKLPKLTARRVESAATFSHNNENALKLTVRVFSFSYKKGIPADPSGNGGGYVFDCRGMNNPGRYDEYKQLTGLDRPVIDFLEQQGEIQPFLSSVYQLADAHVQDFLRRGFTNLQFCFGCTGGQHRSVYSAQHLAEYLSEKYGVRVELTHREQAIEQVFEAKQLQR